MILVNRKSYNNVTPLNGLNGWWGSFWGGVASVFTASTSDDNQSGAGLFGRLFGKALNAILPISFAGMFKENDYVPTSSEINIINPIKSALNNWIIQIVSNSNAFLDQGNYVTFSDYVNQSVRQVQLLRDYYLVNPVPGLSNQAQLFLVDQIDLMVQTFESTVENLFTVNEINFNKIVAPLSKLSVDQYPTIVQIPDGFTTNGFLYQFDVNSTTVIDPTIPPIETIAIQIPTQSTGGIIPVSTVPASSIPTATPQNTASPKSKYNALKAVGFLAFVYGVYEFAFSDDDKSKKESKI